MCDLSWCAKKCVDVLSHAVRYLAVHCDAVITFRCTFHVSHTHMYKCANTCIQPRVYTSVYTRFTCVKGELGLHAQVCVHMYINTVRAVVLH